MYEEPIGILLSKKQWNNVIHQTGEDLYCHQYVIKAQEIGRKVIFFTMDHISVKDDLVEAFELISGNFNKMGKMKIPSVIYNPTKYNKKRNIKNLRELVQSEKVKLINEHHVIKQKHFTEIIQSNQLLKDLTIVENNNPLFHLYVVCQKGIDNKWVPSYKYIKNIEDEKYTIDEFTTIIDSRYTNQFNQTLDDICINILNIIHFYFPGLYELGLKFALDSNGEYTIDSTITINTAIKDIEYWKPNECKKIVESPIVLANSIYENKQIEKREITGQTNLDRTANILDEVSSRNIFWVKFKEVQATESFIKLPNWMFKFASQPLDKLLLGTKEVGCDFHELSFSFYLRKNTYENPVEVIISNSIVKKMHLPLDLVYQISFVNGVMVIGPVIGLLLGEKNQTYTLNYMEKFTDRLGTYESFGGIVFAFSSRSINWRERIAYGMIYDPVNKRWRYDSAPIPSIIYRRNFHQDNETINKLKIITNNNLFNSHHFTKSDLSKFQELPQLQKHLPQTHHLKEIDILLNFIKNVKKIILKPINLSRGRGIFILEHVSEQYLLYEYSNNTKICHQLNNDSILIEKLKSLNMFNDHYLFQTYLPLLKVDGSPFDVRVVMQKYSSDFWKCSGIECRVAGKGEELTNIARGGRAMHLEEAISKSGLSLSYQVVYKRVLELSQKFCSVMDQTQEHYAEFGLDIALDEEGNPWILEANIFPSFKGFKKMDYETYLKIRYQPLYYAIKQQGFQVIAESGFLRKMYNSF